MCNFIVSPSSVVRHCKRILKWFNQQNIQKIMIFHGRKCKYLVHDFINNSLKPKISLEVFFCRGWLVALLSCTLCLCRPSGWLRSGSPMEKPLNSQPRAVLSWWRRRSCRWWTVPALAFRGATSSPSCLAWDSASPSASGATWGWPLWAWWMTTLSSRATRKCSW